MPSQSSSLLPLISITHLYNPHHQLRYCSLHQTKQARPPSIFMNLMIIHLIHVRSDLIFSTTCGEVDDVSIKEPAKRPEFDSDYSFSQHEEISPAFMNSITLSTNL